ncbi:ABC transporter permease [Bacillus sp. JCM 19034]|uniref:ABC transporter permease n=1 Tax=Bacillus sp. JCM 19034 TaxID=1481928 RepID=UPI000785EE31|nr:ABC transporter permease [Bacillus sp. JCM 19034]
MRVLSTIPFTLIRMLRNYIVLLLLLVVPIILLTVFSVILSGYTTETGEPYINHQAVIMVLVFQMFGGSIVMSYIYADFFQFHKIINILPFNKTMYAFSIMMCGTAFSVLLGIILMVFTQFVLGVHWENWLWAIYNIALLAILSSVVCLIFTFSFKNYKVAERLSEVYGVGFILLAGLFFPMPKNAVFDFFGTYGNPLTLAVGAIHEMAHSNSGGAWYQANILLVAIIVLFIVMLVVGRRRIA